MSLLPHSLPRPPRASPCPQLPGGFAGLSANGCLVCLFNIDEGGSLGQPMESWGCVCISIYIHRAGPAQVCVCL